jgi:hypothetical protein
MLAFEPTRDLVGIEANRLGVRPDEGAPEDAARPSGDVISFEPFQQRDGILVVSEMVLSVRFLSRSRCR